jgi:hypothetical protein
VVEAAAEPALHAFGVAGDLKRVGFAAPCELGLSVGF